MPPTVFELMITPIERSQTYASDRRVTSFGQQHILTSLTVRLVMEKKRNTVRSIEKTIYSERLSNHKVVAEDSRRSIC